MKKTFVNIFLLFVTVNLFGQSTTTSFTVAGIKVILKPTIKEVIDVNMYYRGGVANYPTAKAGLENLVLAATTEAGTKKYNANAFRDRADMYGIDLGGSSGYDNGMISMTCISRFFNQGWDLFASAVANPVFEPREIDMLKEKIISGIKQSESDPDDRIEQLTMQNAFAGTPYATNPTGEEATLSKVTASDIKSYYYNTLLNKNRMFMVIVGKITKEEVTKKILASFAALPAKPYKPALLPGPKETGKLLVEQRQLATNYITASIDAPKLNSPDYLPFRLAISHLSNRLFREIRTKRNLSYAPYAYTTTRLMPYAVMYVSTTEPKASVEVMLEQLKDLRDNGFAEEELLSGKSNFITSNYMKEESSSAIASALGNAEVMGDWRIADEAAERINKVTLTQMNAVLKKYINTIRWSYLGDQKLANENAAVFKSKI